MNTSAAPADTKIVFFGNERLATGVTTQVKTLRSLIAAGYDVVAIVSHHTRSRSRSDRQLEIATVAAEHDIPLLLPEKPGEITDQLTALDADIGVLVAYGKIVPQAVIDIFPHGIINVHPSLLPLHRGPIPLESVILDGADTTGVSVMQLVKAMDAGPVYGQTQVRLYGTESKQQMADTMLDIGGRMVVGLLPAIMEGSLQPQPQDDSSATYDALITKTDGVMDMYKPAIQLEREIRAYLGWPGSRTVLAGRDVVVTAAHVATNEEVPADRSAGTLFVTDNNLICMACTEGILVIDRLKPAGKHEMSAQDFLNGYGKDI